VKKLATVLIVDDSQLARSFMRKAVEGRFPGCKIYEAGTAKDALAAIGGMRIECALVDLNMPGGINGLALARSLKDANPRMAIALVTANIQEAVRQKASGMGVSFIPKPVNKTRLNEFFDAIK